MTPLPHIHVVAAIVPRNGRFLLTQRLPGSHMGGYWEFPGGKIEAGETHEESLVRELREELGVSVDGVETLWTLEHEYPQKRVTLHFLRAQIVGGEVRPLEVADFGWFLPEEMEALPILPADLPVVARLAELADE